VKAYAGRPNVETLRPTTVVFCAVLALAIGLSVVLRGRRLVHFLFAAFATSIAFWYASQSLADFFRAKIWIRATGVLSVLLPQAAIHLFQSVVPVERGAETPRLTRWATFAALPMLALVASPYQTYPLALGLTYSYVFGLLAAALISLARRGQRSPSRAVRDRVRFLVLVGALAATFTAADFLSFLGVHLPPVGAVFAILFLFVLAESLTRPRLADIYEMAARLMVATVLAFCLAGIFYLFIVVVGAFKTMYLNAVLSAILFLVLFEPLQTEIEGWIHQVVFRERRGFETSVMTLRRELAHVLEIDAMVSTVLAGLERSRRVTSAALYLRDQDGEGFDVRGGFGITPPEHVDPLATRPLLERLKIRAAVSLDELAREPEKGDPAVLTAAETLGALKSSVVLGVRSDDGDIIGLLCVADERVRDAFTPEEVALLETLVTPISVVLANSRVYSRMKERDRLAALGSMAAGLAHEVKNPLGAIKGAAQLLEESADPTSVEFVEIILEEVDRLDRVVGSFLDYARPHAGNPVPMDVNAAVRRTVQIFKSQATSDVVEIELALAEELPRARIDPEKFRQVLLNLLQNGLQAMDGGGKITVSTSLRRGRRPPASERVPSGSEPEFVEISVRDTGHGISQKVLKNLFVPFFTTKTQGTGLGLAISQSIVQNAGGTIDVQSQSALGTTFTVVLPVADPTLATVERSSKASIDLGAARRSVR
jgi:signal transduction histidine kinase